MAITQRIPSMRLAGFRGKNHVVRLQVLPSFLSRKLNLRADSHNSSRQDSILSTSSIAVANGRQAKTLPDGSWYRRCDRRTEGRAHWRPNSWPKPRTDAYWCVTCDAREAD